MGELMHPVAQLDKSGLLSPARARSHIAGLELLPLTPPVAILIEQILLDPGRAEDFRFLVDSDPLLLVNLYRCDRSLFTGQAISPDRMYPEEDPLLRSLLLAWTLERGDLQVVQQEVMEQFALHSLRTAVLSRAIAARTQPGLERTAYQTGLLHDLGKALLLLVAWQEVVHLYKVTLQSGGEIYQGELLAWNYSHAQTGEWLLSAWRAPGDICVAIGAHHQPELLRDDSAPATLLAYIVHLANHLDTHAAGMIHEPVGEKLDDKVWEILDLNPSALDQLVREAEGETARQLQRRRELWSQTTGTVRD